MALKRFVLTVIFTVLLLPALASAGELQRDTWYIGFGLGLGLDASVEYEGEDITLKDKLSGLESSGKYAFNFKVGITLNERNLLGLDITTVRKFPDIFGTSERNIYNSLLMWTHFPREEGFFTRLGGGISKLSIVDHSFLSDESYSYDVNGYGLLVGVGYTLKRVEAYYLTVNLDHSRQSYGGDVDGSQFTILYLGFDWY